MKDTTGDALKLGPSAGLLSNGETKLAYPMKNRKTIWKGKMLLKTKIAGKADNKTW